MQSLKMEKIALVNENDKIIGFEDKLQVHEKGLLHRAVSVFIFNSKNQLLMQKRAEIKYHSGGLWSNTCCTHQRKDELLIESANRCLIEEMGIKCKIKEKFIFNYQTSFENKLKENEIDHVFIGFFEGNPLINREEVSNYKWRDLSELEKAIKEKSEEYSYWFKEIIKRFLPNLKEECQINFS